MPDKSERPVVLAAALLFPLILVWGVGVWCVPYSGYWRDGCEFVISAFALDIAHPAGFPVYSQIANLFTLIPLGPIAWRVNLLNAFLGAGCSVMCGVIGWILISRILPNRPRFRILALLSPALLFFSPAFLRQWLTTEVYLLNTLLIEILFFIYLVWEKGKDHRLLFCAAFLSGLGAGNHVSILAALLLMTPVIFVEKGTFKLLPQIILFFTVGLAAYGYLPARAHANPPLNTGSPTTVSRFWSEISDQRDRELRQLSMFGLSEADTGSMLLRDIRTFSGEVGIVGLLLAVAGIIVIAGVSWRCGAALAAVAASNWIFFFGWTPDPWIPALIVLLVSASCFLARALAFFKDERLAFVSALLLLFLSPVSLFALGRERMNLGAYRDYDLPAQATRTFLSKIDYDALAVVEPHWFLARYMTTIEGYRDDIQLLYLPELLFPQLFRPLRLSDASGSEFDASQISASLEPSQYSGENRSFAEFLKFTRAAGRILLEPAGSISGFISPVLIYEDSGVVSLKWGEPGSYSPEFESALFDRFLNLKLLAMRDEGGLREDAFSYLEVTLSNYLTLLQNQGKLDSALKIGTGFCGKVNELQCSSRMLNNLSAFSLGVQDFEGAARWALLGLKDGSKDAGALNQNLRVALEHLPPERKKVIITEFSSSN